MESKKCTKCGEEKGVELFNRDRQKRDGRCPRCKVCTRFERRIYIENNKDLIKQQKKNEYNKNKSKYIYRSISNYNRNKDKVLSDSRIYRAKNKEKISLRMKCYSKKNMERIKKSNAERYATSCKNIDFRYLKRLLIGDGFTREHISQHPELIELKRLIIKTKRL